jgi:hypothetical protein
MGYGRISLSKKVKDSVKSAVKFVNNYERTAAELALRYGYDYVVCGHIHQPKIQLVKDKKGRRVTYLNSGDWVENLSALEYHQGRWSIFHYYEDLQGNQCDLFERMAEPCIQDIEEDNRVIFHRMVEEFRIQPNLPKQRKDKVS